MLRSISFRRRGFTLVEVIISLVILGIGVIFLLRLFPTGLQRSAESERLTRATLLAQEIMEAIKAAGGSGLVRIIPGSPELVPMPGDGVDGDEDGFYPDGQIIEEVDLNGNGTLDADYDGYPERDYEAAVGCSLLSFPDTVDNDLDGITDDDGDSNICGFGVRLIDGFPFPLPQNPDGDLGYDPEMFPVAGDLRGVDEEFPNGIDDDGNGIDLDGDGILDITIDEDVRLASNYHIDRDPLWWPLEPGDGIDNDGDGEEGSPVDALGRALADGIDNNGDGRIDEGIDEEIFDGQPDPPPGDYDNRVDEDCRAASYPFAPRKFFRRAMYDDDMDGLTDEDPTDGRDNDGDTRIDEDPPNDDTDQFAWQIIVARVPDGGGDGINNDGDWSSTMREQIDEEIRNGLNEDPQVDDLIDEDCQAAPVRGFRRITVRITWNGNGDANRDGFPGKAGEDDDKDGGVDFLDPEIQEAMRMEAFFLGIDLSDPVARGMLEERWAQDDDEDGRIDEERKNGLDDDHDGKVDEDDFYQNEYNLTGFLEL